MISIYCSEKLDGVAAASIVLRHAVLSKLPAHFGGFLHPDTLSDELKEMAERDRALIFVLDVSLSPEHLPILDKVALRNRILYWNTSDPHSVVPNAKIFDRSVDRKCSAELVFQRFLPKDSIARQLSVLAHEVKFWQVQDERAAKLSDLITAKYDVVELMDSLSKGIFWTSQFDDFYKSYLVRKSSALDELLKSLKIKSYLSYRFGFAFASPILDSADACQSILDAHAGVDVSVVLFRDGRLAFRRRDNIDVDLRELAELFNGGGHPYASGARLNQVVKKENYDDVLFHLDQVFRNFFVGRVS